MNPFHNVVFYPINAPAVKEKSDQGTWKKTGPASWVWVDGPPWQDLPCCGGTCTRGICDFHNCPPEEK